MPIVMAYFRGWVVFLIIAFALSSLLATWLIRRHAKTLARSSSWWLILLVAALWGAEILRDRNLFKPTVIVNVVTQARTVHSYNPESFALRWLAENPLLILDRMIFANRPEPLQPRPVGELSTMSDALKAFQLPLGRRQYPPLGLKPFNHIVMFGTESLSLDFLSPYNTNLPPGWTPFYASPDIASKMFLNYQCIALPTQPGLAATYCSHPNANGLMAEGNFELSLIKYLNAQGYDTYFLMSMPDTFLNNDIFFKKMGFQHVIGSLTWMKDPKLQPFIAERGLMDRALDYVVLNLLETNRDRKIFIQVMNADTHSPYPRSDYGSLQYPPTPAGLAQITSDSQAQAILTGIFRHDYDIGQTIREMQKRNLLTENTLVILTADHNYPHSEALNEIPGYPKNYFSRIPLAFLSGQPLPRANLRQIHSQLDFAPTIAHLLGLPVEDGWWGESIFAPDQNAASIRRRDRNIIVTPLAGGPQQTVSMDRPQNAVEKNLVTLFTSVYTNSPPAGIAGVDAGSQTNSP
jgi:hypothetical protein